MRCVLTSVLHFSFSYFAVISSMSVLVDCSSVSSSLQKKCKVFLARPREHLENCSESKCLIAKCRTYTRTELRQLSITICYLECINVLDMCYPIRISVAKVTIINKWHTSMHNSKLSAGCVNSCSMNMSKTKLTNIPYGRETYRRIIVGVSIYQWPLAICGFCIG